MLKNLNFLKVYHKLKNNSIRINEIRIDYRWLYGLSSIFILLALSIPIKMLFFTINTSYVFWIFFLEFFILSLIHEKISLTNREYFINLLSSSIFIIFFIIGFLFYNLTKKYQITGKYLIDLTIPILPNLISLIGIIIVPILSIYLIFRYKNRRAYSEGIYTEKIKILFFTLIFSVIFYYIFLSLTNIEKRVFIIFILIFTTGYLYKNYLNFINEVGNFKVKKIENTRELKKSYAGDIIKLKGKIISKVHININSNSKFFNNREEYFRIELKNSETLLIKPNKRPTSTFEYNFEKLGKFVEIIGCKYSEEFFSENNFKNKNSTLDYIVPYELKIIKNETNC